METCIFCQIVTGQAPCHPIWEDDGHLAFLSIFPNTPGFSVLFPMHGTAHMKEWRPLSARVDKYFERYEGYIASHDYERADDAALTALAKRIRGGG
jgi:hypothetical protein